MTTVNPIAPQLRFFDEGYYVSSYPDVLHQRLSPLEHYLLIGWREGRDPGPYFSTVGYLEANSDVARDDRINPFIHFLEYGLKENRTGWEKVPGRQPAPQPFAFRPRQAAAPACAN
ncbi:hypothetical protein [Methylobacterium organophilum]|uniref:Uncharacterized protein n=1 Tax=Methylobacterium organophilum TaxID=410 RepID=A0ABQ4T4A0_METOR|nr:hypothetical protein [Methylobacterium organophilum]UMY17707.1 hypothetical protein MMB17_24400 [Methylobacterium organophilum]GJE26063.1 hypothetical protein LKMONMHP_0909 [Methylobacterium organophilum]